MSTHPHYVNDHPILPPFPDNTELALFGLGCFWGAEKRFWTQSGVYSTAVGYSNGSLVNPSYRAVCSGTTGHSEVVRVVFEVDVIHYTDLLQLFWTFHDPTQGMRQGNDIGTQYRSGIYYYNATQRELAETSLKAQQEILHAAGRGDITTEILPAAEFYYAEDYHQQYLAKNPNGYCG